MKRLPILLLSAAILVLYVVLPDPFGSPDHPAPPPRLEEAGPPPDDDPPAAPQVDAPATSATRPEERSARADPAPPALVGRVTDLSGRPVSGARLAIMPDDETEPTGETLYDLIQRVVPPPAALAEARSGDDGGFELPPPGPGFYRMVTEARGYARDVLDIELTVKEPGGEADIVLTRGTELSGRVVDRLGRGLRDVVVFLRAEATPLDAAVELATVTDRLGRYRFISLPAGRDWGILVKAAGHVRNALAGVRLPQTHLDVIVDPGEAYRVRVLKAGLLEPLTAKVLVREGEVPLDAGVTDAAGVFRFRGVPGRRVTVHVRPDPATHGAGLFERELPATAGPLEDLHLEVGRPLTGVVLDTTTQRGLAGAEVCIDPLDHAGILPSLWLTCDAHGTFVIPGYAGRGVEISAFLEGYVSGGASDVTLIRGWPHADVRVPLAPGGTIVGRVRGPQGTGIPGVTVRVVLAGGLIEGSVVTGADGGFTMKGVPVRRSLRVVGWREDLGYAVSRSLALEPGLAPGQVDLQLGGLHPLKGHVIDELGGGLPGARIVVETVEEQPLIVAEATTGARGQFDIPGLTAGHLRLTASLSGHVAASVETRSQGGAYPPAEITLRGAVSLEGRVLRPDRQPAAEVVVKARPAGGGKATGWGFTDVDGRFWLAGVGPGRHVLEARARDGTTATVTVEAGLGHVTLYLLPSSSRRGSRSGERK